MGSTVVTGVMRGRVRESRKAIWGFLRGKMDILLGKQNTSTKEEEPRKATG